MLYFVFFLAVFCLVLDVLYTSKGISKGIAKEANVLVTFVARTQTPNAAEIFAIEASLRGIILTLAVLLPGSSDYPLVWQYLAGSMFVGLGLHNIKGASEWRWMLRHPGQKLPVMNTVWQKLIGFWG